MSKDEVASPEGQALSRRRTYTKEQRRRIVAEATVPGTSVSMVARRHDVNTNLVFKWIKRYPPSAALPAPTMLPVEITPAAAPLKSEAPRRRTRAARKGRIEITLSNGHRVEVVGAVDAAVLRQVVETLSR